MRVLSLLGTVQSDSGPLNEFLALVANDNNALVTQNAEFTSGTSGGGTSGGGASGGDASVTSSAIKRHLSALALRRFAEFFCARLKSTLQKCGYTPLANLIVIYRFAQGETFKKTMQNFVEASLRNPLTRFASVKHEPVGSFTSATFRSLIHQLAQYASPKMLRRVEATWRVALKDLVVETCVRMLSSDVVASASAVVSSDSPRGPSGVQKDVGADANVTDALTRLLQLARSISLTELASTR